MNRFGASFWIAGSAAMLGSAALQSSLAYRLHWFGGQPDFPLAVALVVGALGGPSAGAVYGFAAGAITGALSGDAVGTWILTRTLSAYAAGASVERWFRPGITVAALTVAAGTLLCGLLTALSDPRLGFGRVLVAGAVAAAANLVFAIPLAAILRRFGAADDLRVVRRP